MANKTFADISDTTSVAPTDTTLIWNGSANKETTAANFIKSYGSTTELTSVDSANDKVPIIDDTDGDLKWTSPSNIVGSNDGWVEVSDTWTYASANTITVPSGAASIYKKGMGIRIKQGAGYKYYYITIVADTLLTVTGGTDFTVANAAITDVAYTLSPSTAIGFPVKFACAAPSWDTTYIDNGTGGQQPTAGGASFRVWGDTVELIVYLGAANVSKNGAGNILSFTIPSTLPNIVNSTNGVLGLLWVPSIPAFGFAYSGAAATITMYTTASMSDNANLTNASVSVKWVY